MSKLGLLLITETRAGRNNISVCMTPIDVIPGAYRWDSTGPLVLQSIPRIRSRFALVVPGRQPPYVGFGSMNQVFPQ